MRFVALASLASAIASVGVVAHGAIGENAVEARWDEHNSYPTLGGTTTMVTYTTVTTCPVTETETQGGT